MSKPVDVFFFYPGRRLANKIRSPRGNYSTPRVLRALSERDDYTVKIFSFDKMPSAYKGIKIVPATISNILREICRRDRSRKSLIISQLYRLFPYALLAKLLTKGPLLLRTGGVFVGLEEALSRTLRLKYFHYWLFYRFCNHVLSTADGTPVDIYMKNMNVKNYTKLLNGFPRFYDVNRVHRVNRILCISRLSAEKNVPFVIYAYAKALPRLREPYVLSIVGDGPQRDDLEKLCSKLSIRENVCFEGKKYNILSYLNSSALQVSALANNPIIEGIVTNTPTIAVELGEFHKLYRDFDGVIIIPYEHGGYGEIPEAEHMKIISKTAEKITSVLNNYEEYVVNNKVDYSAYGWGERISREILLYQELTHNY